MTDDEIRSVLFEALTDGTVTTEDIEAAVVALELQRRIANDNGKRHTLDDMLKSMNITREELDAMRDDFDNNDQSAAMENGSAAMENGEAIG